MTSKEVTYQYRLAKWSELMKERTELGQSIRAYCAMKGFAENTYFINFGPSSDLQRLATRFGKQVLQAGDLIQLRQVVAKVATTIPIYKK